MAVQDIVPIIIQLAQLFDVHCRQYRLRAFFAFRARTCRSMHSRNGKVVHLYLEALSPMIMLENIVPNLEALTFELLNLLPYSLFRAGLGPSPPTPKVEKTYIPAPVPPRPGGKMQPTPPPSLEGTGESRRPS